MFVVNLFPDDQQVNDDINLPTNDEIKFKSQKAIWKINLVLF